MLLLAASTFVATGMESDKLRGTGKHSRMRSLAAAAIGEPFVMRAKPPSQTQTKVAGAKPLKRANPNDFFSKAFMNRFAQDDEAMYFVGYGEETSNFGGSGYISVWNPFVWKDDEFSSARVDVYRGEDDMISAGWVVFPFY